MASKNFEFSFVSRNWTCSALNYYSTETGLATPALGTVLMGRHDASADQSYRPYQRSQEGTVLQRPWIL